MKMLKNRKFFYYLLGFYLCNFTKKNLDANHIHGHARLCGSEPCQIG